MLASPDSRQAAVRVLLGDRHDQTEIGLDQRVCRPLGLRFSAGDLLTRLPDRRGGLLQRVRQLGERGSGGLQLPLRVPARRSR